MDKISCPSCGHKFDVEQALSGQLEAHIKAEYDKKASEQTQKLLIEKAKLEEERQLFAKNKERENELFNDRLKKQIAIEQEKIQKQKAEEFQLQIKALEDENTLKKEENRALKLLEISLKQKENILKEQSEELELKLKKQLLDSQQEIEEKVRKKERESFEMERLEFQKKLNQQQQLAEEQIRKVKQGSMQLQGEVQELAIEDWLSTQFPLDTIEEIKKGARGGDCLQHVNTRSQQNCGIIYYESKRTKEFQPSWIEKFKTDIREKGANIGVLVTEVMPSDMERMGLKDGVWICSFDEFKGLCSVLRETIIQLSTALSSQENKGDKMVMLYDYLTSPVFKMQIEAIVEGFTSMKTALDKEKNAMQRIWKEREKQIDKVVTNTIDLYGSVRGIAGNAALTIAALELGEGDDLED